MDKTTSHIDRRRVFATALKPGDVIADHLDKNNLAEIVEIVKHGHNGIGAWCREGNDHRVYYHFGTRSKVTIVSGQERISQ